MKVTRRFGVAKYLIKSGERAGVVEELTISGLFMEDEKESIVLIVLAALARCDAAKMCLVPSLDIRIMAIKLEVYSDYQVL